jgi:hypothetical protein
MTNRETINQYFVDAGFSRSTSGAWVLDDIVAFVFSMANSTYASIAYLSYYSGDDSAAFTAHGDDITADFVKNSVAELRKDLQ